jgi:hypothetical protein
VNRSAFAANPALWLLVGMPTAAVIMGVVIVTLASNGPTDLVRDDYYKAGLAINEDLTAEEAGEALGLTASLTTRGPGRMLVVVSQQTEPFDSAPELIIELPHPTLAGQDLRFSAPAVSPGRWVALAPRFEGTRTLLAYPPDGRWRLKRVGQQVQAPPPLPGAAPNPKAPSP